MARRKNSKQGWAGLRKLHEHFLEEHNWMTRFRNIAKQRGIDPGILPGDHFTLARMVGVPDEKVRPGLSFVELEEHFEAWLAREQIRATLGRRPPPLGGTDRKVADYITAHPGMGGKEIADALKIDFGNFRRIISAKLKPRGFTNSNGYHPPSV